MAHAASARIVNWARRNRSPGNVLAFACLMCLLAWAGAAQAQISVDGVEAKEVYRDRVSFTVHSEAGFEYTARLNGEPIPTDVSIEVDKPEYYELNVERREPAFDTVENLLVQFIVRAGERGSSEWGLPAWIPYPTVDSAAAEFAGARLKIVTPAEYPVGLEIPVIARVEDESGRRLGVNGIVTAGFEGSPLRLLRGVGSVFLPAATEPNTLLYAGRIHSLQTARQIVIEEATAWQTVSEDVTSSTDWGEGARIHITDVAENTLTIAAGATLTIGAGSVVLIDPDVDVVVEGGIVVNGTAERPVVFTPRDRNVPWGGFVFESDDSYGQFIGAILTGSGADPEWFDNNPDHGHSHRHNQCLFYLSDGAEVTLADCYLVENHGQAGHGEHGYLTMTGCLVQKCITAGQYNHGAVVLEDCALIEFPTETAPFADDDNDGLYLTGGAHCLTDCLIGWALDDGVDAGSGAGGSVTVQNCWFESCYHEAMAWSESRDALVADTVALNCGQGIECGFGSPDVNAVGCFSTANAVGARFGDNYDWSYHGFLNVRDSLLLFNLRDVWGRAWDDWTVHLDQIDVQNNVLSIPNPNFPDNRLWDPQGDPNMADQLTPFLPAPAAVVGVGLATYDNALDRSELPDEIPVRLSTFTTSAVAVDYAVDTDDGYVSGGTLHFIPGETVKHIPLDGLGVEDVYPIRVTLSNPVNAELTGHAQIVYQDFSEFVEPLVVQGDQWRYFKGTQEPPADWNTLAFDDSAWPAGPTGIGYETGSGYESCLATNLDDMEDNYLSVYARREFFVEDPAQLTGLTLTVDVDDGCIAYLNGIRIHSKHAPDPPRYDEPATANHEADCDDTPEPIDLSAHLADLVPGFNVLAVQVHNVSLSSSDFLFIPELFGVSGPLPDGP